MVGLPLDPLDPLETDAATAPSGVGWFGGRSLYALSGTAAAASTQRKVRFSVEEECGLFGSGEDSHKMPRRLSSEERLELRAVRPDLDVRDDEWAVRVREYHKQKCDGQPDERWRPVAWLGRLTASISSTMRSAAFVAVEFSRDLREAIADEIEEGQSSEFRPSGVFQLSRDLQDI